MPMTTVPDLPRLLAAALAEQPDSWDESVLHASDLRYGLPDEACARQLWLRLRGAEKRQPHAGERLMWRQGHALQRLTFDLIRPVLEREYPGWHLILWEHSLSASLRGLNLVEEGQLDSALVNFKACAALPLDAKSKRGGAFRFLDVEGKASDANEVQVQAYCIALDEYLNADVGWRTPRWHVPGAVILAPDREGQNFCRQFYVPRDDDRVYAAAERLRRIRNAEEAPPVLPPLVTRKANKGPDSIRLLEPWQCRYCPYRDVSCPGALPPHLRDLGIVGKVVKEKDGSERYRPIGGASIPPPDEVHELVRPLIPPAAAEPEEEDDLEATLVASLEALE